MGELLRAFYILNLTRICITTFVISSLSIYLLESIGSDGRFLLHLYEIKATL